MKAKTRERTWSDSEGEIQKQSMENLSYTETFIYPLEQVKYIKI